MGVESQTLLGQEGLWRCYLSCFLLVSIPELIRLLVNVETSEVQARDAEESMTLVIQEQEGDSTQETPVSEILRDPLLLMNLHVAISVPHGVIVAFKTRKLLQASTNHRGALWFWLASAGLSHAFDG